MTIFLTGLALYAFNLLLGILAWRKRMHFGWFHHFVYALVFAGAIAATVFAFHPALFLTLFALALLPATRPRSFAHPGLAVVGFLGYVVALLGQIGTATWS